MDVFFLSFVTLLMGLATGILFADSNKRLKIIAAICLFLGTLVIFGTELLIAVSSNDYGQWLLRAIGIMLLGPVIAVITGAFLRRHGPNRINRKV